MNASLKPTPNLIGRFGLTLEQVHFWYGLTERQRADYYDIACSDTRSAVYWENMNKKLGQRAFYGRGASLAGAIMQAHGDKVQRLKAVREKAARLKAYRTERLLWTIDKVAVVNGALYDVADLPPGIVSMLDASFSA